MNLTEEEREELRGFLTEARGNLIAVAHRVGMTREQIQLRVHVAGLNPLAARLRAEAGVSGPRKALTLTRDEKRRRREAIVRALKSHGSQQKAADALGVHRRRLQREMLALKIP